MSQHGKHEVLQYAKLGCLTILGMVAVAVSATAHAQAATPSPRNVVQLSASGSVEVDQDWLVMVLAVSRDGREAASVQRQLQQAVDTALGVLRPLAQAQDLQVRSGNFGVYPRHDRDGKISGWRGRAEIMLEGRDFPRVTQAAAKVDGLTVERIDFQLSRQARAKVQEQAQTEAISAFKLQAQQLAQQFGFTGYSLREVSVNRHGGYEAMPMRRMAIGAAMSDAKMEALPISVEAGKVQVQVEVAGSVQLE